MDVTIKRIVTNEIEENSYVVCVPELKQAFVVDPGGAVEGILGECERRGCALKAILLTHGHFDHILGVGELKWRTGATIYAHRLDAPMLMDASLSMGIAFGYDDKQAPADDPLDIDDKAEIEVCGQKIEVLHTPGHTRGSVCYYLPDKAVLFSGDTVFKNGYGRVDFPGGSATQLRASLKSLQALPGGVKVYSGHGMETTIAAEAGVAVW